MTKKVSAPDARKRPANHLLASMPISDFELLRAHLEPVDLPLRLLLEGANKDIKWIYFPSSGVASVVARAPNNKEIEVGLIGSEGMTGVSVVLGNHRSLNATYMQVAGSGLRMPADKLRAALHKSNSLQNFCMHFAQAFMAQMAHTALSNGRAKLEERLARWVLMVHDRTDGDALHLTHEFIATMLGVHRPGVTTALSVLESEALILVGRSAITVIDREGLRKRAGGIYGVPEREYQRLIKWTRAQRSESKRPLKSDARKKAAKKSR